MDTGFVTPFNVSCPFALAIAGADGGHLNDADNRSTGGVAGVEVDFGGKRSKLSLEW